MCGICKALDNHLHDKALDKNISNKALDKTSIMNDTALEKVDVWYTISLLAVFTLPHNCHQDVCELG